MRGEHFNVVELTLIFKYRREDIDRRDMVRIERALRDWAKPCKHAPHSVSFILVTRDTAMELMERLAPVLDDITAIEDGYTQAVSTDVVGLRGGIADPFRSRVLEAWAEKAKREKPKYVPQRRPRHTLVKHRFEKLDRRT